MESSSPSLSSVMGHAVTTAILLSGWDKYGLSERVCYHFDLTEALADAAFEAERSHLKKKTNQEQQEKASSSSTSSESSSSSSPSVCGVLSLLECVPTTQWHRLTRKQRKALKNEIRNFNVEADRVRRRGGSNSRNYRRNTVVFCLEPPKLPLRLNPGSRIYFAYETTRIAFCLDASPTLTSTYGFTFVDGRRTCCPMDRIHGMAKTFFTSLVRAIPFPSATMANNGRWQPELAVTVLAVFPRGIIVDGSSHHQPHTSLLVRDFRVNSIESAELLAARIEEWALGEVETEIGRRLSPSSGLPGYSNMGASSSPAAPPPSAGNSLSSYDTWTMPMYSSSLRDLLEAGDAALSILSSAARPCIVLATDGRSVSCDGIIDIVSDADRVDVPLIVLDLSSEESHQKFLPPQRGRPHTADGFHLMSYDPGGAMFPLHLSDDTEALYGICKATNGCFLDAQLLAEAARTKAGEVDAESPLMADHFFSLQRHSIRPNAVQWYTLFSLSPLSPTFHSAWGKLTPPEYIRRKLPGAIKQQQQQQQGMCAGEAVIPRERTLLSSFATTSSTSVGGGVAGDRRQQPPTALLSSTTSSKMGSVASSAEMGQRAIMQQQQQQQQHLDAVVAMQRKPQDRQTFSTYIVNPIRIKGLLLMRVKEGFRAKQYGQSTNEPDKVFIQFMLPLELGTVLHYEVSYKALPGHNQLVGFAHIKIELSGEASFIQSVKNDFLRPEGHHVVVLATMAQQVSAKLCKVLRWIRKEDMIQSYLSPVKWSDQLSSSDTPFVRRLGTLTPLQRRRHFRFDEFDCVCIVYTRDTDDFLFEFRDVDDGEEELIDAMDEWATQTIKEGSRYVCRTQSSGGGGLASYCVVELSRSPVASRVFTVAVESFGGSVASDRLSFLSSLKQMLATLKHVRLLPKQMGQFLVGVPLRRLEHGFVSKQRLLESQHNHTTWDLVKDPELLPLLVKRRTEIGAFLLLDSSDNHALFAKLLPKIQGGEISDQEPGDLVQYELSILSDKVVVHLHMECTSGEFFPFRDNDPNDSSTKQQQPATMSAFCRVVHSLKKRDQECGRALRSRTNLLRVFGENNHNNSNVRPEDIPEDEPQLTSVKRLLAYASRVSVRLRFFHPGSGAANQVLRSLTEDMLLSQTFGPIKVAKLSVDPGVELNQLGPGDWFLVQFDKHTMSIVHLSWSEKQCEASDNEEGPGMTYRELCFFTIGISDLYSKRDDVADDGYEDDHISEHLCLTDFSDALTERHRRNYSSAAYIALKNDAIVERTSSTTSTFQCFDLGDLKNVMDTLEFVEITGLLVPGENGPDKGGTSKLWEHLSTVLRPVPDDDYCLFYKGNVRSNNLFFPELDDDSDALSAFEEASGELRVQGDEDADEEGSEEGSLGVDSEPEAPSHSIALTPIFVRFSIDGRPSSVNDLSSISQSSNVAALVSVFSDNGRTRSVARNLPTSHLNVAVELAALLNAYVAERTLERLRHHGSTIYEPDIRLAKTCLRKALDVVTSTMEVYFYVAKRDSMVSASAPAGCDAEVEEGFKMLLDELQKNGSITFKFYGDGGAIVVDTVAGSDVLAYWCFVKIRRRRGVVEVKAHHPDGPESSSKVMSSVHELISMCCHRVNQILLLQRLHRSRATSLLLIPAEEDGQVETSQDVDGDGPFHPGLFSCAVVFRTSFHLYHRCAANPAQVARTLEATVLHIFAISNRRRVFVYKDETGSIFYMRLEVEGGGASADGKGRIDLVVHGIDDPGPSVTMQLKGLLQKRLLVIAVDMLSLVLAKNPRYSWRLADLRFVQTYEREWRNSDNDGSAPEFSSSNERTYCFPRSVLDPGMLLLYFRQNLCGSTFFHPLNSGELETMSTKNETCNVGDVVCFDSTDLLFYYNNAQPTLHPSFQAQSTLTKKGQEYARLIGNGIALVDLVLLDRTGNPASDVATASVHDSNDAPLHWTFRKAGDNMLEEEETWKVAVKITATCKDLDSLHEWILLTLDQVAIAWTVERHLERMQLQLLHPLMPESATAPSCFLGRHVIDLDNINPGLPLLCNLLHSAHDLPHPAILKTEHTGMIRSSAVAPVALEFLDRLQEQLHAEGRGISSQDFNCDLSVIRLSRGQLPRRVLLSWDSSRRTVVVRDASGSSSTIRDSPVDCPEYICFYCFQQYTSSKIDAEVLPPRLFTMVAHSGPGSERLRASLESLNLLHKRLFNRSFAFVLSVKRNRRILLSYNWSSQLHKSATSRLLEKNTSVVMSAAHSMDSLQRRSLKELSPASDSSNENQSNAGVKRFRPPPPPQSGRVNVSEGTSTTPIDKQDSLRGGPSRRLNRPVSIRRPKLIGKSVDGAAMRAVAASRARASSNMFKGSVSAGSASLRSKSIPEETRITSTTSRLSGHLHPADSVESATHLDSELAQVLKDFDTAMNAGRDTGLRLHSVQSQTFQSSTNLLWPVKAKQSIPPSVSDFLLSHAYFAWSDVAELVRLPQRILGSMPLSLGQTLAAWIPGLRLVPHPDSTSVSSSKSKSILLTGEAKNVRSCKCFTVVRLSLLPSKEEGGCGAVGCDGWVLTLPRRKGAKCESRAIFEKDATGMDKLAVDMRSTLSLEGVLFDFLASLVERSTRSGGQLKCGEALSLVRQLAGRHELKRQVTMFRSNYKAFEATIVLKSYENRMIDMFEGPALFGWLMSNVESRNLFPCGHDGLCFKREVAVRGTHSVCFLTCDEKHPTKMRLVILCRTQGRDLYEYMFPETNGRAANIAISVVNQIAALSAGFAYTELVAAATHLRRDDLWAKASKSLTPSDPGRKELNELIKLCTITSVTQHLSANHVVEAQRFLSIMEDELVIDWKRCCALMEKERCFSPSFDLSIGNEQVRKLSYMSEEDVFVLIRIEERSQKVAIDLVERDEVSSVRQGGTVAAQKLANFVLHNIWYCMMQ